ncbi:MAG TPA: hypothetical protein PKW33_15405, partial [Anaerolineaceae bacterium]|nr:hypothetical protein [Anaerolineaceae bacterium]HPN52981.1 hypothetical protein [Anaerolineaceae bacterium]
ILHLVFAFFCVQFFLSTIHFRPLPVSLLAGNRIDQLVLSKFMVAAWWEHAGLQSEEKLGSSWRVSYWIPESSKSAQSGNSEDMVSLS